MKFIFSVATFILFTITAFSQEDAGRLLNTLNNANTDTEKINSYSALINHYQYANPDSAIFYARQGLSLFTNSGNKLGIAKMTFMLASEDEVQGRMDIAKKRYKEALELYKDVNYRDGIATVYNGLGVLEGKSANYDSAARHFMLALKIFEGTHNKKGIITSLLKLGVVNEQSNNLDTALQYYNKVKELTKDDTLSPNSIFLYNNIAIIYGKKGDYKTALEYLQTALAKTTKPEYMGVRILSLNNIGIVYDHYGDTAQALKYFRQVLQITQENNLPEEHARALVNMSSVVGKTDPAKANEMLQQAYATVKQINQRSLQLDILDYMVQNYEDLKDYKNALITLEREKSLQDSIFSIEKAKEIANMQAEFDLEKSNAKVQQLELLSHKNLLQRNVIITVAAVMLITLVILTFFLRKITRLNEQLEKREAELQKSNKVKDKLFSIIGHDLRGPIGNIPAMLRILRDEGTTGEEQQYIYNTLLEHSEASLETLDKLLYWGKAQIKGTGIKQVDFNPEQYIQNNLQLIKSNCDQKQIKVENMIKEDLTLHGDPAHFDFIIRNLLSNAVKFTHNGGSISILANKNTAANNVVFTVSDTGVGIAKEKINEIFEPFSNSTRGTADEKGTSIGLMLCKEFVIENGGKIWAESAPGKGSSFHFSFKTA